MKCKRPKEFVFKSWFIGQLRRISYRYPARYNVMNAAKEPYYIPGKNNKQKKRIGMRCSSCHLLFPRKEVVADHKEPVVPTSGFPLREDGRPDWNVYIDRMFIDESGWNPLCKGCHKDKTSGENKVRRWKKVKKT